MTDDFMEFDLPAPSLEMGDGDAFDQASIDALFGGSAPVTKKSGLKAVIESRVISHERLPMLEVVCEHMVRSFATSKLSLDEIFVSVYGEQNEMAAR